MFSGGSKEHHANVLIRCVRPIYQVMCAKVAVCAFFLIFVLRLVHTVRLVDLDLRCMVLLK